jgi:hypothetical protein
VKVLIYVEGPSDKAALEAVLQPLIERKNSESVNIHVLHATSGDRKQHILTVVPKKAANYLNSDPRLIVVAMPDLYPGNVSFPHETYAELRKGILDNFAGALREKRIRDRRVAERFHVFCFKHDLESLILAANDSLRKRLKLKELDVSWTVPVEDQDHGRPPSKIVEELFAAAGDQYVGRVDAPLILKGIAYADLAEECPQCFKPFVEFLEGIALEP